MSSSDIDLAAEGIVQKYLILTDNSGFKLSVICSVLFMGLTILESISNQPHYDTVPSDNSNKTPQDNITPVILLCCGICFMTNCAQYFLEKRVPYSIKLLAMIVLVFCCYFLERLVHVSCYLSVYIALMSSAAIIVGTPKLIVFAVCVAYTSFSLSSKLMLLNKTLLVWCLFFVSIPIRGVLKRIFSRVSSLIQTLLVLKTNLVSEVNIAESIVAGQLPQAIIMEMQKEKSAFSYVPDSSRTKAAKNSRTASASKLERERELPIPAAASLSSSSSGNKDKENQSRASDNGVSGGVSAVPNVDLDNLHNSPTSIQTYPGDLVARKAAEKGIVPPYTEARGALSVTGVDRRLAAVIAIKRCTSDDGGGGGMGVESVMSRQAWHVMLDLFDHHAHKSKITCVRRCGDVWVGCLGFFNTWKNSSEDCYHALDMACVAVRLGALYDMRVCCAVDYGSVIGGFIHENLSFDLIAQEVRWVLSMVEINKQNEVFVSAAARTHALARQHRASGLPSIKFHKTELTIPIISSIPTASPYVVSNVFKITGDPVMESSELTMCSSPNFPITMSKLQEALLCRVPLPHTSMSEDVDKSGTGEPRRFCEHRIPVSVCSHGCGSLANPLLGALAKGLSWSLDGGLLTVGREFSAANSCCFCRYGLTRKDVLRTLVACYGNNSEETTTANTSQNANWFSNMAASRSVGEDEEAILSQLAGLSRPAQGRTVLTSELTNDQLEERLRPLLLTIEDVTVQVLLLLNELCLSTWWDIVFLDSSALNITQTEPEAEKGSPKNPLSTSSYSSIDNWNIFDKSTDVEAERPLLFSPYMWEPRTTSAHLSSSDPESMNIGNDSPVEDLDPNDMQYSTKLSWQLISTVFEELSFVVHKEDFELFSRMSLDDRKVGRIPRAVRTAVGALYRCMGVLARLSCACCVSLGIQKPVSLGRSSSKVAVSNESVSRSSQLSKSTTSDEGVNGEEPFKLLGALQKTFTGNMATVDESFGVRFHGASNVPAKASKEPCSHAQSQQSIFKVQPFTFLGKEALVYSQYYRGWGAYMRDVCVLTQSSRVYRVLWLVLVAVAWVSMRQTIFLVPNICSLEPVTFLQLTAFYFGIMVASLVPVDRPRTGQRFVLLLVSRCFLLGLMSLGNCNLGVSRDVHYSGPDSEPFVASGSMKNVCDTVEAIRSGDSSAGLVFDRSPFSIGKLILVVLLCWIPSALQTSMKLNAIELICFWVVLVLKASFVKQACSSTTVALVLIGSLVVFLCVYGVLWLVRYCALFCYVMEHRVVQATYRVYQLQTKATDNVLNKAMGERMAPNAVHQSTTTRGINWCPTNYNHCDIIAIHIKAADILPGLVPSKDLSRFVAQMTSLLDQCVRENGLTKISHFSGVYFAAICRPIQGSAVKSSGPGSSSTVTALRYIQQKLDRYNAENHVNVAFGIGVCRGSLTTGLLGSDRYCYDCAGRARDTAYLMAIHEADGLLITDSVAKVLPGVKDVLRSSHHTLTETGAGSAWLVQDKSSMKNHSKRLGAPVPIPCASSLVSCFRLSLDASAGGRSLEDMEYVTMLGQGGYGSVHLMREVATSTEYAVKAIPRKSGSSSAKHIRREFLILQQMQHPNVINFKYCIMTRTRIYLVMNYVRGGNLKQIVERLNLDITILRLWYAELILALEYVHGLGIIHRDVKPANCIIGTDGHLMLADFGLSKLIPRPAADDEDPNFTTMSNSAVEVMRKVFPTKPKIAETDKKELPISILLIDSNYAKGRSAPGITENVRVLNQMYFDVVHGRSVERAVEIFHDRDLTRGANIDVILLDIALLPVSDGEEEGTGATGAPTDIHTMNNASVSVESGGHARSSDSTEPLSANLEPSMTAGLTALTKVRDEFPKIPVIVVSSHDQLMWLQKLLFLGAKEVLISPLVAKNRDIILKYGRISRRLRAAKDPVTVASETSVESSPGSGAAPVNLAARRVIGGYSPISRERSLDQNSPSPSPSPGDGVAIIDQTMVIPSAGILQKMGSDRRPAGNHRAKTAAKQELLRAATVQQPPGDGNTNADTVPSTRPVAVPVPVPMPFHFTKADKESTGKTDSGSQGPLEREKHHSAVGTPVYMAPEVLCGREYDKTVDYWATGVTFYECATGSRLFNGRTKDALFRQIVEDPIDLRPVSELSRPLGLLVLALLNRRPDCRVGANSADDIKQHEFFAGISWSSISHTDPAYKPTAWQGQPVQMKSIEEQKRLFYGETPELKGADPFGRQEVQEMGVAGSSSSLTHHRQRRNRHRGGGAKDTYSLVNSISNRVNRTRSRNNISNFRDLTSMRRVWISGGLSTNKNVADDGLEHDWDTGYSDVEAEEEGDHQSSDSASISSSWGSMLSESASGVVLKSKKVSVPIGIDTVEPTGGGLGLGAYMFTPPADSSDHTEGDVTLRPVPDEVL